MVSFIPQKNKSSAIGSGEEAALTQIITWNVGSRVFTAAVP